MILILIYLIIILISLIVTLDLNDKIDNLFKSLSELKSEWFYIMIPGVNILLILLWLYWKIKIK